MNTPQKDTLCNLINAAWHDENKAVDYYSKMLAQAYRVPFIDLPGEIADIREIRNDEMDHREKFRRMLDDCPSGMQKKQMQLPEKTLDSFGGTATSAIL